VKQNAVEDVCLEGCEQNDPRLVNLIRTKYLEPPSSLPYNFTKVSVQLSLHID
jgi:hypothetical protein